MSTWGANTSTANTVPSWYVDRSDAETKNRPNHPLDNDRVYAGDRGWIKEVNYTDQNGNTRRKYETIIANRQLSSDLGALHVTDFKWGNVATQSTVGVSNVVTFEVTFNFPVSWATAPSVFANGATWAGASATLLSGNTTNKLTYAFTTNASPTNSLNVPHNTITGTIVAWDPITSTALSGVTGITGKYDMGANLALTSKSSNNTPS